jgi:FKBP-type peptidyl-prolyl cis-trans isomerase
MWLDSKPNLTLRNILVSAAQEISTETDRPRVEQRLTKSKKSVIWIAMEAALKQVKDEDEEDEGEDADANHDEESEEDIQEEAKVVANVRLAVAKMKGSGGRRRGKEVEVDVMYAGMFRTAMKCFQESGQLWCNAKVSLNTFNRL